MFDESINKLLTAYTAYMRLIAFRPAVRAVNWYQFVPSLPIVPCSRVAGEWSRWCFSRRCCNSVEPGSTSRRWMAAKAPINTNRTRQLVGNYAFRLYLCIAMVLPQWEFAFAEIAALVWRRWQVSHTARSSVCCCPIPYSRTSSRRPMSRCQPLR